MAVTLLKKLRKVPLYPGDKAGTQDADILGTLAVAQRLPGLRKFFLRTTKIIMRGKIRRIADIAGSVEVEQIVQGFSAAEANIYLSLIHI